MLGILTIAVLVYVLYCVWVKLFWRATPYLVKLEPLRPNADGEMPIGQKDGVRISQLWALSKIEAHMLHREIFGFNSYLAHGLTLRDGETVLDVGANIGVFSTYMCKRFNNLKVLAWEPVPEVFRCLELNVKRFITGDDVKDRGNEIELFNAGLSTGEAKTAVFDYSPMATMAASSRTDSTDGSVDKKAGTLQWIKGTLEDNDNIGRFPAWFAALFLKLLEIPVVKYFAVVPPLFFLLHTVFVDLALTKKRVECKLLSLEEAQPDLPPIDLMNIDVEGAEMDVLLGIGEKQWPLIRQIVIEVHDVDGRVTKMTKLLEGKGYKVTTDVEDWAIHKLLGIYTMYAQR
jgi:31-O-methyltransferase